MRNLRILFLVLAAAAASHALGDRTVFDTTSAPPPVNPRKADPFVIGLELGVNSLSSVLGGRATWYPVQQVAVDLGGAWSYAGMRGGVGLRWFTSSEFNSPFVGLAWKRSAGVDSASLDNGGTTGNATVTINPIQWVDAQVGYEIRRTDGLVLVFTTGWSTVVSSKRSTVVSGNLSKTEKDNLEYQSGSGPIAAVSVGMGF